ncbi:MAG: hypothetical protein WD529_06760 [Balneolaceae bacterium]
MQTLLRKITKPYRWFFYQVYCRNRQLDAPHVPALFIASVAIMGLAVIWGLGIVGFTAAMLDLHLSTPTKPQIISGLLAIIVINMIHFTRGRAFAGLVEEFGEWEQAGKHSLRNFVLVWGVSTFIFMIVLFIALQLQN